MTDKCTFTNATCDNCSSPTCYYEPDDCEDDWDDWDEQDDDDDGSCPPCRHFACPDWGGDGLCMVAIREQAGEHEDYFTRHVSQLKCPVCQKELTCYDVRTDELWTWPGDWYSPMVGLQVYAAYDVEKGEYHRHKPSQYSKVRVCHVWIGEGEYREERLIRLLGKPRPKRQGLVEAADIPEGEIPF